MAANSTAF